jgi:hypothetical protein
VTSALDLLAVCVPLASCTAAVGCFRKSSRFFRGAGERPDTEPELSREGDGALRECRPAVGCPAARTTWVGTPVLFTYGVTVCHTEVDTLAAP